MVISSIRKIVCYEKTMSYAVVLSVEASVHDPSSPLFAHLVRPCLILSTDCGVLIVDQIYLVIPDPRRFPDALFRVAHQKRLTGTVARTPAIGRGRPRLLAQSDAQYLLALAHHNPTLFLDEYHDRLDRYRYMPTSMATIHRTFERARLSVKCVQKMAAERDPIKRADFTRRIGQYPTNYLISIDEVSKDDRTYGQLWGRLGVGHRTEAHQPFVRKHRFSMVAALSLDDGIFGSKVVEGSFQRETFLDFLRDSVVSRTTSQATELPFFMTDRCHSQCHTLALGVFSLWIMHAFIMGRKSRIWSMVTVRASSPQCAPGLMSLSQGVALNTYLHIHLISTQSSRHGLSSRPIYIVSGSASINLPHLIMRCTLPASLLPQK
jgi:hypothetical protein